MKNPLGPLGVFNEQGVPDARQEGFRSLLEDQLFETVKKFQERHPLADGRAYVSALANCLSEIFEEHSEQDRAKMCTQVLEYIRWRVLGRVH